MTYYTFVEYTGRQRIPKPICTIESRVKTADGFRRLFFKLKPDALGYGYYKFRLTDDGAGVFLSGLDIRAYGFIRSLPGSTNV